jgi:hypothetical protein
MLRHFIALLIALLKFVAEGVADIDQGAPIKLDL